jgi:methylmalonyl-CoA epimerase
LELLEPTGEDTPIGRFISSRGEGVQQLAFEVDDLESLLEELSAAGVALIDETPQSGAAGTRIAFVHPKSTGGVLVELLERE